MVLVKRRTTDRQKQWLKKRPNWYVIPPETQRHKWTQNEQYKLYTLSIVQKRPFNEIFSKFPGIDIGPLRNQIRLLKGALAGQCYRCRKPLKSDDYSTRKPGRILYLCHECKEETREYKSRRRRTLNRHNLCAVCGKNRCLPGKTTCQEHLSPSHRRRYAQNLCGQCGKNPIDQTRSIALCSQCLDITALTHK